MATDKDYSIGIDIGTNSTGYAMVDMDAHLLKHKNRSTFGAVLFDSANTAAERRGYRSTRRRLDRRIQRIKFLQELMEPDIFPVDSLFFLRMNETFFQPDDRLYDHLDGTLPNSVWIDGSPSDYPTIYHLRHALIENEKQADIRYVYLALHHIVKYRGNFLLEGEELNDDAGDISERIADVLNQLSADPYNWNFSGCAETVETIWQTLKRKDLTNAAKAETVINCLNPDKASQKAAKALAGLFVGIKSNIKELFRYDGDSVEEKIQLSSDWDEEAYIKALGTEGELFEEIVSVYRWKTFANLRVEGETISQTMIRRYEKHGKDLEQLKAWFRQYTPEEYNDFFRDVSPKKKNYPAYSGHFKKRESATQKIDTPKQADFYDALKKILNSKKDEEALEAAKPFMEAMNEDNGFLPLLRLRLNSSIPNQLQAQEMELIIDQQGRYYSNLLANKDKILSICTFRLPYYVGPLNTDSPFQKWLVRKEGTPVRPWNFDEVIDKEKTANGFIDNLTNKCTYLPGEDVLPHHSLLYEEYLLLDELNRVRINGELIPVDLKERVIEELFKRRKNVTKKAFVEWLQTNTVYSNYGTIEIKGFRGDDCFAASLRTYIDFTEKVNIPIDESTIPVIETLIHWSTVFEDRGILKEKIHTSFPYLKDKQVNYICQRRYTGWGRLSKTLLDGIQGENQAEGKTVIDMMRTTNENFMQVINHKTYGFDKAIEERQMVVRDGKITLEEVENLQGSPSLKRGVWQAVKIVEELIHSQGKRPKAIYIENTRGEDEQKKGKRLPARIRLIEDWYRENKVEVPEVCRSRLNACRTDKVHLNDRQYLYFLQLGKCLYSGKALDYENLEQYDIDHILPQSYIKDDSLENRALVYQSENRRKEDSLLLDETIQRRQSGWWKYLNDHHLMSEKKYRNLTRKVIGEHELVGFINRQLTETRQIIKHVANLFKAHYPDIEVHMVNAGLSATIRDTYGLFKIRDLNDTHHAFDAFLAASIGVFTDRFLGWIGDQSVSGSMARAAWNKNSTNGIVAGLFGRDQVDKKTGEVVWNAQAHIAYLKAAWNYKDHFIVYRKTEYTGAFYNETRYPAGAGEAKYPLKRICL